LHRHYKIRPSTDHLQHFAQIGLRISEISCWQKNK